MIYLNIIYLVYARIKRDITQLGSVSALGAESRRFESCYPESKLNVKI